MKSLSMNFIKNMTYVIYLELYNDLVQWLQFFEFKLLSNSFE